MWQHRPRSQQLSYSQRDSGTLSLTHFETSPPEARLPNDHGWESNRKLYFLLLYFTKLFSNFSYSWRNVFVQLRKPKIQPDWNNVKSSRRVQRSVRCTWTLFTVLVTNQAIYRLAIIVSNFLGTLSWFNFMRSRRFVSFPCWKYNSEMLLEDISLFNCLNGYTLVFQPYLQDIQVVVYSFSGLQCRISLNFNSVGEI